MAQLENQDEYLSLTRSELSGIHHDKRHHVCPKNEQPPNRQPPSTQHKAQLVVSAVCIGAISGLYSPNAPLRMHRINGIPAGPARPHRWWNCVSLLLSYLPLECSKQGRRLKKSIK
jgi:hypothetical protein